MERVRAFYIITLKGKGKKKDLRRFLENQWLPLLKSIPECQEIQLLQDFQDRAGYYMTEVWESSQAHDEWNNQLFQGHFQPLWKEFSQLAMIEFAWSGVVIAD